ncbi:carboxymuconolactone decarboxylase family protein [Algoriphagus sp. A40]|uniref:carboxymuconolactone decarboxylase family protein n=1 Tax=Algoriphagus sp. A40 TaxID=1945863 RepID=UPI0009852699|nr:peroxidase-related enzyme [Algoriphagus sp. A40]OOG69279.1 carboxymuconolactone decarboxylase [Algoriphagus sp. A40]
MPYINLENSLPGIRSLVQYRPETGRHLYALVRVLLTGDSTLSKGERELIAAFVSSGNGCTFCTESHASAARILFQNQSSVVDEVLEKGSSEKLNPKMNALLQIAGKVQVSGKEVRPEDIDKAKSCGATDLEIHDAVLISAVFCLFNRYVDGLGTSLPEDSAAFEEMGHRMISNEYKFLPNPTT